MSQLRALLKAIKSLAAAFLVFCVASASVFAQSEDETASQAGTDNSNAPLVVPIYPRLDEEKALKSIEDLKDAYVVLEDGAVVSMADWVLGSLNKSKLGAGMSDYQTRMFLGQVARAVAGLDQDMVYKSFEDAGPLRPFVPKTPPPAAQITQGILSYFIPALRDGWKPVVPEPTLANDVHGDNGGTLLFDRQFKEAVYQSSRDLIESGRMQNMLKDAETAIKD